VLRATPSELEAHAAYIDELERVSKRAPVWKSIESTRAATVRGLSRMRAVLFIPLLAAYPAPAQDLSARSFMRECRSPPGALAGQR